VRMVRLTSILIVLLTLFSVSCTASEKNQDANSFWQEFRQAVVNSDSSQVAPLTRFPFEVRGPMDSDPVIPQDPKGFVDIYERLLVQQVYLPEGGQIVGKTMRSLVAEKTNVNPEDFLTDDSFQVFQFQFRLIDGKWLFTRAYLEE